MNRIGNRFKSESDQKRNRLQFYIGNPFQTYSEKKRTLIIVDF